MRISEEQIKGVCNKINVPYVNDDIPTIEDIKRKLNDIDSYEDFYMGATSQENIFIMGIICGANYYHNNKNNL